METFNKFYGNKASTKASFTFDSNKHDKDEKLQITDKSKDTNTNHKSSVTESDKRTKRKITHTPVSGKKQALSEKKLRKSMKTF